MSIYQSGYSYGTNYLTLKFAFDTSSTVNKYRVKVYMDGSYWYSSAKSGSTSYSNVTVSVTGLDSGTSYSGTAYLEYYTTAHGYWAESGHECVAHGTTESEPEEGYAKVICGTGCYQFTYAYAHADGSGRRSGTCTGGYIGPVQCDHFWIEYVYPDDGYELPWSVSSSGMGSYTISGSRSSNYANTLIEPTYDYSSSYAKTLTIGFTRASLTGSISATATGIRSIYISWSVSYSASWVVKYKKAGTSSTTQISSGSSQSSYISLTSLDIATTYWFYLYDSSGNLLDSTSATTTAVTGTISATASSPSYISVSWSVDPSSSWTVKYSIGSSGTKSTLSTGTSASGSYAHSGLSQGTTYYYWLYDGDGNLVDSDYATTKSYTGSITATKQGISSIYVSWSLDYSCSWVVKQSIGSTGTKSQISSGTGTGSYIQVTGLTSGTKYYYWLYDSSGNLLDSAYATTDSITGTITATASSPTSISVSWTVNPSSAWSVKYKMAGASSESNLSSGSGTSGSYAHSGLNPGVTYWYYLYNKDGNLIQSTSVTTPSYTYRCALYTYMDDGTDQETYNGSGTSYTATPSNRTKAQTSEYKYTFVGWSTTAGGTKSVNKETAITVSSTDNHGSTTSGSVITYWKKYYAVFTSKELIASFAWTSNDSTNIIAGNNPSSHMSANTWNNSFRAKIAKLCSAYGITNQTYTVTAGTIMSMYEFNSARNTLSSLATTTAATQPPSAIDKPFSAQTTSQILGLKTSLNSIISKYNES